MSRSSDHKGQQYTNAIDGSAHRGESLQTTFLRLMSEQPEPPCAKFGGCKHIQRCAEEEIACEAFHRHQSTSQKFEKGTRELVAEDVWCLCRPSAFWYDLIFPDGDIDEP